MSDFEMPYFLDGGGNKGYFKDSTAREQISVIANGQRNVWFPDLYDYNTKIKTLTADDCQTYVQNIGDLSIAYVYSVVANNWGSFSVMAQFRNFPNGTTRCLGGCVYNGDDTNIKIQASYIGVYFRPNITGTFGGTFSAILFFSK